MRFAICSITLVLASTGLIGCGQSGELQLANSPDYDKRAKYLLYSNESKTAQSGEKQTEKKVKDQLTSPDQTGSASQANSN
ncbi:hypothetical protein [Acinetobacter wuhouensis]|uniref:Lipoprotein n=1 Tax=Acinetobacter wuhouensis TaxID=1879050 RepID=A0A4Q7AJ62_9GAMM|nr:hypothetical protein [Acinetobacter wuhouensis]RZG43074.1 hypothetical protein EXU28_18115 [Acinetobacter wuhouensis]RZG67788.1 hypothetical protein EXU29_18015 [Acinetobacter wuhouensis]